MEAVLITTDIVQINLAKSLLSSHDIDVYAFDEYISCVEGSINIFPIRLMVPVSKSASAKRILEDFGLEVS